MMLYPGKKAHNPKVLGSNPSPATNLFKGLGDFRNPFFFLHYRYVTKTIFLLILRLTKYEFLRPLARIPLNLRH